MTHDRPTLGFRDHEVPAAWLIGDFELEVAEVTDGRFDEAAGLLAGSSVRHGCDWGARDLPST